MSFEEMAERLARASCPMAPKGEKPVHRRTVTLVAGKERETCKYCGDVKEHPTVRYAEVWEEPETLPEVPDGFHIE